MWGFALTVVRFESLAENKAEKLARNTALIKPNFSFEHSHSNLQWLQ